MSDYIKRMADNHEKMLKNFDELEKGFHKQNIKMAKKCQKKINEVLSDIEFINRPYREVSIAKTKLEEAEMWLGKLTGGKE